MSSQCFNVSSHVTCVSIVRWRQHILVHRWCSCETVKSKKKRERVKFSDGVNKYADKHLRRQVAWLATTMTDRFLLCNHRLSGGRYVNLAIIHSATPTICLVHALTGVASNCDLFEAGWCNVPVIAGSAERNDRLYERRHAAGVVRRQARL